MGGWFLVSGIRMSLVLFLEFDVSRRGGYCSGWLMHAGRWLGVRFLVIFIRVGMLGILGIRWGCLGATAEDGRFRGFCATV